MITDKRVVYGICFSVLAFLGLYISVFQRILDMIARDYSVNKFYTGFIIMSHFGGLLLGPLIVGELSDRFGRRVVILNAFVLYLIGLSVVFASNGLVALIAGIFIIGMGFGILEGSVTTLLTDLTPGSSNRILNISQIFFCTGTVTGPFLATAAVAVTGDWKWLYAGSIAIVLFILFAFSSCSYPNRKIEKRVYGTVTLLLLKNMTFIRLCLSMVMYIGIEEGIAFWISTFVQSWNAAGYYPSIVLSLFWGSMIIGRFIISRYSGGLNKIIIFSIGFSGVFVILGVFFSNITVGIISFFMIGLSLSGIWPMLMALTKMHFSEYSGTAYGIMMSCCAVGGIIVPFIMGYIGEIADLTWALLFVLIPLTVIFVNHFTLRKAL